MKKSNTGFLALWIWVVGAFILLIGAWTGLIYIAQQNAPEPTPLVERT